MIIPLLAALLVGPRMIGQSSSNAEMQLPQRQASDTAQYRAYNDSSARLVMSEPVSTFGLDTSTASYANVRRFLKAGRMPHPDAIRIEELLNYFPPLVGEATHSRLPDSPLSVAYELAPSPWNRDRVLLWLAFQADEADDEISPPANLVFLVDVSGSMSPPERLPLAKSSLRMLVRRLRPQDCISIVTYAGTADVVLRATPGDGKAEILAAIERLGAGGGTAGGDGLRLAYEQAKASFVPGGINRILLCTDGDYNVGVSSIEELTNLVERERESGVTLSVLGFGDDNLNDAMLSRISSCGNGNYSYIDSLDEAGKVLDEELAATFVTVARDAKVQIEFNPQNVREYRQIGYEKRHLNREDFNDDRVDAGDLGAGKRVTVLYELALAGSRPSVDPLRYAQAESATAVASEGLESGELAYLKFRWKAPGTEESVRAQLSLDRAAIRASFLEAGSGLRFAAAVAAYGQKLRANPNLVGTGWHEIAAWAEGARRDDRYRAEFVRLVQLAERLGPGASHVSHAAASM